MQRTTSFDFVVIAFATTLAFLLVGCDDDTAAGMATPNEPGFAFSDDLILGKVYAPEASVPAGFYAEPSTLLGLSYTLRHLRATDIQTDATFSFELCTDDMSQAIAWSDSMFTDPTVATVLTVAERDEYYQITRQRIGDEALVLHRLFKCGFLNRDGVDPNTVHGAAGFLTLSPSPATELRQVAEYLWQFSAYSNPGATVLASHGEDTGGGWRHTLHLALIVPNAGDTAGCDRVERVDWRYDLDASGALQTERMVTRGFDARITSAGPERC